MSSSASSVTLNTNSSTSSAIDQLVSEYTASVSQPVTNLQTQQSGISSLVTVYNQLKTNLANLESQASSLGSIGTLSPLSAKSTTASDSSIISATAQNTATSATHNLLVTQLAKYDTLVSNQLSQSGTDISGSTGAGTFSFTINGGPDINVNVSDGDTNSTLMANIAAAVNNANLGVTASVVDDTTSTARLVFESNSSGSTNALSVSDDSGNLLQSVGWSSDVVSSRTVSTPPAGVGTGAGFVNSDVNSLDANFTLDGIPIMRGSNTVSDVLTGVTLNLQGTQQAADNPVTLTIASNTSSVQSTIQNFINSYNTVISSLNLNIEDTNSTSTSSTTVTRGSLAGDVTFMNLQTSLQNVLMGRVSSAKPGNPNTLSAIGIKLNDDGTLSISDQAALTSAITSNPGAVVDLFNSPSGVAVQLDKLVKSYSSTGGILDQKINGAQDQISFMNDQINSMQARINEQANAMRDQFTAYESQLIQLTQTQSTLTNIWNSMISSGLLSTNG